VAREHGIEQEEEEVTRNRLAVVSLEAIRDRTYEDPTPPFNRCENCKHCWEYGEDSVYRQYVCRLVIGKPKEVHPNGVCAKHER